MAREFRDAGLRFNELPPELVKSSGMEAHYFVFPISKFRHGLDIADDYTLFLATHNLVLHDPSGQFAALTRQYADLPDELVRDKVEFAFTRVLHYTIGMNTILERFQPLCWLEYTHDLMRWALELCCWLDREPPVYSKWLIKQARGCSTADIILPPVSEIMRSVAPAIENALSEMKCEVSLREAADALEIAARRAAELKGFGDLPRRDDMHPI
jgi:hypothetical protein